MAKAKKATTEPAYNTGDVTLVMSSDEAIVVTSILGNNVIGGGIRHTADKVYYALRDADVGYLPSSYTKGEVDCGVGRAPSNLHQVDGFGIK